MPKKRPLRRPYISRNPNGGWARSVSERLRFKRKLVNFLGGKCIDCGFSGHLAALDFDHLNPKLKKFSVSYALRWMTLDQILPEIKKCVIRCANCHRIKTYPNSTI